MNRHELLSEIGTEGQKILSQKRVAIMGLGALGSVASELMVRAKIGALALIDRDVVEESNLQRQTLYALSDIGKAKVVAARGRLLHIDPKTKIEIHPIHLCPQNIGVLERCDLILDCTDNLRTRFLINDFANKSKIPWIYAAAIKTHGYVMPLLPYGPCLSCILKPAQLETCDTVGVLNTITTAIASLQVSLAYKILLGKHVDSTLTHLDIWRGIHEELKVGKNPSCSACQGTYIYLQQQEERVLQFCSSGKFQILGQPISLPTIKHRWEKVDTVIDDGFSLYFRNILLFADGRALIAADSKEQAEGLYSTYVGN